MKSSFPIPRTNEINIIDTDIQLENSIKFQKKVNNELKTTKNTDLDKNINNVNKNQNKKDKKYIYILVEPEKHGAYVISVSWSDSTLLEKVTRRNIKIFSKDQKVFMDECAKIYSDNQITKHQSKNK